MRTRFLLLAVPLFAPLAASAQPLIQSQEGIALQNEILQLQQQIQQLQAQGGGNGGSALGGGNAPPPSGNAANGGLVASLLNQVQTLQSQVQSLNGQVSELQHEVDTQNAQTQKDIGDLKFQLQNGGAAGQPGQSGQAPAAPAPQASTPSAPPPQATATPSDPKAALQAALDAYGKHDYATSARLAQGIVAKDKSAPQAYRAQYLVAQSYAAKGDPQNAAIAYDSTYNMNHNGTYAPHALLGLASSLAAINQKGAACDTIASLNSQFTNQSAGMRADVAAVAKRAHCS